MKIISYNVDGLPETLDLSTLPKLLKPIAWIYKKIKKTTIVPINDGINKEQAFIEISKYLDSMDADIIVLQEYFNYSINLDEDKYNQGIYTGGFDLSKIPSNITFFPPRFKCDGLYIFTKYNIVTEEIIPWKTSHGYFTHANDKLTHKGFRYYKLMTNEGKLINVYNIHMDADFYDHEKCANIHGDIMARKKQMEQLVNYIKEKDDHEPTIIIGDTNSYPKYAWDEENVKYLTDSLGCKEIIPTDGNKDCDRVFIMNMEGDKARSYLDMNERHSDHRPLIVEI